MPSRPPEPDTEESAATVPELSSNRYHSTRIGIHDGATGAARATGSPGATGTPRSSCPAGAARAAGSPGALAAIDAPVRAARASSTLDARQVRYVAVVARGVRAVCGRQRQIGGARQSVRSTRVGSSVAGGDIAAVVAGRELVGAGQIRRSRRSIRDAAVSDRIGPAGLAEAGFARALAGPVASHGRRCAQLAGVDRARRAQDDRQTQARKQEISPGAGQDKGGRHQGDYRPGHRDSEALRRLDSTISFPHPWYSMLKLHLSPMNRWRVIRVGKPIGESVNDR